MLTGCPQGPWNPEFGHNFWVYFNDKNISVLLGWICFNETKWFGAKSREFMLCHTGLGQKLRSDFKVPGGGGGRVGVASQAFAKVDSHTVVAWE